MPVTMWTCIGYNIDISKHFQTRTDHQITKEDLQLMSIIKQ